MHIIIALSVSRQAELKEEEATHRQTYCGLLVRIYREYRRIHRVFVSGAAAAGDIDRCF